MTLYVQVKSVDNMMNKYIGIDVGKAHVDICWLKDPLAGKKTTKRFKNKPDAFAGIQRWLIGQTQGEPANIVVLLEATGVYHEALSYFLYDQGFKLIVSSPGKAKKFAQSMGLVHKTDKSDAAMLAHYGYSQQYSLAPWKPKAQEIRELKAMMRRLSALEKDCQRENNRLEAIDDHIDHHPVLCKNKQRLLTIKGVVMWLPVKGCTYLRLNLLLMPNRLRPVLD